MARDEIESQVTTRVIVIVAGIIAGACVLMAGNIYSNHETLLRNAEMCPMQLNQAQKEISGDRDQCAREIKAATASCMATQRVTCEQVQSFLHCPTATSSQ